MLFTASTIQAAPPPVVGFSATIPRVIPGCVTSEQHVKIPATFTNIATKTESVTVRLAYVTSANNADQNSLIVAAGTDHLLGPIGNRHWTFQLTPGQSVTKTLVALVQPAGNQKSPTPMWGFTEIISAANVSHVSRVLRKSVPYCAH